MRALIMVFIGGGLGSMVRYSLGRWVNALHSYNFPYGTLIANVAACFVLGLFVGLADHRQLFSPNARLFWTVGFCGGFSTFSTFGYEALTLLQGGFSLNSLIYVILSLLLSVLAVYAGLFLGESL
ncbi:MAG: fluoride efflux transporter CrcB [Cyclobacteriaceae bacterium]|jgi:fluoride exporter|nr:fluoride efflux transporter CrcB [Cyclobacteriaceae bacterium]